MQATHDDVRWDLSTLYSGLDGADYRAARERLLEQVEALMADIEKRGINAGDKLHDSAAQATALADLLLRLDDMSRLAGNISVFLTGFTSVDAFNDQAQAETSTLRALMARWRPYSARISGWIGRFDLPAALKADARLQPYAYYLERTQVIATHLMSDSEEGLAAALAPSGGDAWAKLHSDLAGKITIRMTLPDGSEEEAGLARLRVLQGEGDRALRKAAYEAELQLLDQHAVAFAAAMNGVKGEVGTLAKKRGWDTPLDEALFQNGVTRTSLNALHTAVREAFPLMRRYLKAKARFLGQSNLAWYDLLAPVEAGSARTFTWLEATAFIREQFATFSPALEALAARSFDERWIDVLPRKGKRNGAFCMGASGAQESRIMLNFGGGLDDVFTLAHELGHAYHNDAAYRAGRTPLQFQTPMTLAETASIFCETLITNAMLAQSDDATRLAVLEQDLRSAAQLIVDIDSRFRIEERIFQKRLERDLSVAELDALMLQAQDETYGDALHADARHPKMWAQKGHYYSTGRSFYNYPYTFGYLFGVGVYARYQAEPDGFTDRYERLLSSTGMESLLSLAHGFGIDVESPGFWRDALSISHARVEEYERLVARFAPGKA